MGLDFNRKPVEAEPQVQLKVPETPPEVEAVQQYDIVADRKEMTQELTGSPEIDRLVSTIHLDNMETIVTFGAPAAEGIAKASDVILNSMSMADVDGSGQLMQALAKVMDRFDVNELKDDPGLFQKLFKSAKKQIDQIISKYQTMGGEVDKIYAELAKYEEEIKQSNRKLEQLFDADVDYYHQLVKYILAGEQACKEIESYIEQRKRDMETTGDRSIQFEIQSMEQALMMMEQRVQDLRTAENVAMQSVPMIKTMQFTNMNLVRKINSAFIITLPVFKQALAQAILLKRQKIQAEAMATLDEKTNELLLRNAQNLADVTTQTARMASSSSIRIETLENTWQTICRGIDETKAIQEDARKKRVEDQARLQAIKTEFNKRYTMPG
ncbi:MAG: toxic anion resistance protein [Clostridia bacterium]|nr:toxic anion resistance protein [Clostridia bacterium]